MLPVHFNSSKRPEPIDKRSPDEIVMEMEEAEMDCEYNADDILALRGLKPDSLLVLLRLIVGDIQTPSPAKYKQATIRLAVLCHAVNLEPISSCSLTKIAQHLGVTRSLVSNYACRLTEKLGGEVRGGKLQSSRSGYAVSALKSHARKNHSLSDAPRKKSCFWNGIV